MFKYYSIDSYIFKEEIKLLFYTQIILLNQIRSFQHIGTPISSYPVYLDAASAFLSMYEVKYLLVLVLVFNENVDLDALGTIIGYPNHYPTMSVKVFQDILAKLVNQQTLPLLQPHCQYLYIRILFFNVPVKYKTQSG